MRAMFVTTSIARRIERAERDLVIAMAEAVRSRNTISDVLVAPIGEAAAVFAGAGSPYNKLVGLGLGDDLDEGALAAVEREFERRNSPLQVELATLTDSRTSAMLTRRGYILQGFENVLGRRLDDASLAPSAPAGEADPIEVARTGPADARQWLDTLAVGFSHPDASDGPPPEPLPREVVEGAFADTLAAPGFDRYLARRGGALAGGASARFSEGVALLCGAATLPEHRRRGVQTALLRERLLDAARAGCEVAVVTTAPGSKSQANVQRQGFSLLYARAILVRAPSA